MSLLHPKNKFQRAVGTLIAIAIAAWCYSTAVIIGNRRDISELDFWSASLAILGASMVVVSVFRFIKWFKTRWNDED